MGAKCRIGWEQEKMSGDPDDYDRDYQKYKEEEC